MNFKSLTIATVLTLSTHSFAATSTTTTTDAAANNSTTTTEKSTWQKLKESPFGTAYYNVSSNTETGGKVNGINTSHYVYLNYKLGNGKFTIRPLFRTTHSGKDKMQKPEYDRTQFRYTRYSVLTEKEHGVGLLLQVRNDVFKKETRDAGKTSTHIGLASFTKNFGKIGLSSAHYLGLHNYNANNDGKDIGYYQGTLAGTYSFNDNLYLAVSNVIYNAFTDSPDEVKNYFQYGIEPEIGYTFKNGPSLSLSYDMTISTKARGSADIQDVVKPHKNGKIYATLYYTIF